MQPFLKRNYFCWICALPAAIVLAVGMAQASYFEIACGACAMLLSVIQLKLFPLLDVDDDTQKVQLKRIGIFLSIPAIGLITCGICLFFYPYTNNAIILIYGIVGLAAVWMVILLLQLLSIWERCGLAEKFLKQVCMAAAAVPLALIVVPLLSMAQTEETASLSCMTTVVAGSSVLLVALNMILISHCEYRSTAESLRTITAIIQNKRHIFLRVALLKDSLLVAVKSMISIFSRSFFMFANALYSAGMGVARFVAVKIPLQSRKQQVESYRRVGIIILISSVCYALYSARLFWGGDSGVYPLHIALIIACYTFVEFGINIKEAIRLRKSKALEAKALRAISFSSTLLCFVLTQTAIMSFANEGDSSFTNALAGVLFGGLAALTGAYVVMDSLAHKKMRETE